MPAALRLVRHALLFLCALWCAVPAAAEPTVVDVGGYTLRLDCRGAGLPAIVLDAGLGGAATDWADVQSALAPARQVCVYDRAGYGGSEPGPAPRTSARIAAELRTLLGRAGIAPPFVLGGHSFGGFNMRVFAGLFPADVAGLVMVDPPHEELEGILEGVLLGSIDPAGRLAGLWRSGSLGALADALGPLATLLGLDTGLVSVIANELDAFPYSVEDARAAELAPSLPMIVIAHGRRVLPPGALGDRLEREWLDLLRQTACTHPRGRYRVATASGHMVPLEEPALVAAALLDVTRPNADAALQAERAQSCPAARAPAAGAAAAVH
jgi:pimeloyl-ACP methyl ester carboxylesterase